MHRISPRERMLLRVGATGAILIVLWALGLLQRGPAVVY
jgi:hypothetical protein